MLATGTVTPGEGKAIILTGERDRLLRNRLLWMHKNRKRSRAVAVMFLLTYQQSQAAVPTVPDSVRRRLNSRPTPTFRQPLGTNHNFKMS